MSTQFESLVIDYLENIRKRWDSVDFKGIEQRLAAIERATTCGTGPNEPHTNSPAQAAVGEAAAVSTDQPPFHVGQVVECVDVMPGWSLVKVGEKHKIEGVKPLGVKFSHSGYWYNPSCFRAIPLTAERESEPTPELAAYRIECERLQRENVDLRQQLTSSTAETASAIGIYQDTCKLLQEARAENERLTKELNASEYQYAGGRIRREAIECRNDEISDLRQQLATKDAEITTLTRERDEASELQLRRLVDALQPFVKAGWQFRDSVNAAVVEPIRASDVYDLRAVLSAATAILAAKAASEKGGE